MTSLKKPNIFGYKKYASFKIGDLVEWSVLDQRSKRRGIIQNLYIFTEGIRSVAMAKVVVFDSGAVETVDLMTMILNPAKESSSK